ncbi:MAG: hypothetical protein LBJ38_03785 [Oscillospiraceae bacterium]|nr:hypothetical protein [Oscillospiraceae bacterium]
MLDVMMVELILSCLNNGILKSFNFVVARGRWVVDFGSARKVGHAASKS